MIGLIYGKVVEIIPPHVIIDTGGVGYKVLVPLGILSKTKKGEELRVYTYTHVREDMLELFGFETADDLSLFELFLTVPGVGPKTAIGIFSAGTSGQIKNAILLSDTSFFSGVPRLGLKNAQKIIIELKSKLGGDSAVDLSSHEEEKEISLALKNFGFKADEITLTLKKIRGQGNSIEEKVKLALKNLGGRN